MKIALFGGTFNPIHNGHINLINCADNTFDFNKIIIMPDKIPPHKEALDLAKEKDRYEMCKIALSDNNKVSVSDYELLNEGKSYSINTIRYLRKKYENAKIFLVIGSDMFTSFHTWKEYKEILKLVTIVVAARNDYDVEKMKEYSLSYPEMIGNYEILDINPFIVSSTEIRRKILKNLDFSCYLPKKVVKYIVENNLYK